MQQNRKAELEERFERKKAEFFREKRRKRYSEEGLVEAAKTAGEFAKVLFKPDTHYGKYHRNGWGCLAVAWTAAYCGHPFFSLPMFAFAGYNFVQALRHQDEVPVKYIEEFTKRYRAEREERRRNRQR